jgi:hypothetical protein
MEILRTIPPASPFSVGVLCKKIDLKNWKNMMTIVKETQKRVVYEPLWIRIYNVHNLNRTFNGLLVHMELEENAIKILSLSMYNYKNENAYNRRHFSSFLA